MTPLRGGLAFYRINYAESFRDEIVSSVVTQFNINAPKWTNHAKHTTLECHTYSSVNAPKGQLYVSPGCNPGKRIPQKNQALKGRSKFFNFHPSLHQ